MTAAARPSGTPRRRVLFAAGVALAAGAFLVSRGSHDDGGARSLSVRLPGGGAFTLPRLDGWSQLSDAERARLPGMPPAVLRRDDGGGLVVLDVHEGRPGSLAAVSRQLDRRLAREFPDFRKVSARAVRGAHGPALLYSYARQRHGTAHTILVLPAGDRSYTLNTTIAAGARDAAREVGRMLGGLR